MVEITELERREIIEAIDELLAAVEGEEAQWALCKEFDRLEAVKKILGVKA